MKKRINDNRFMSIQNKIAGFALIAAALFLMQSDIS
jgi:hypothetical protein